MSMNKVILVGNLGRDPEIRHLENGTLKATFSLATSESYKNKDGERIIQTEWHNIVLWRGAAEIAQNSFKKGNRVYIEGKLVHRSYINKEGDKKYITEVVGRNVYLLDKDRNSEQVTAAATNESRSVAPTTEPKEKIDELPF